MGAPPSHQEPALSSLDLFGQHFHGLIALVAIADHCAAKHRVRYEAHRDDDVGAKRSADGNGNRVYERAVEQPAVLDAHRLEKARAGHRTR